MDEDLHGSEGRCCNAVLCLCAFLLKQADAGMLVWLTLPEQLALHDDLSNEFNTVW